MKKILSFVLAVFMVAGVAASAFAATTPTVYVDDTSAIYVLNTDTSVFEIADLDKVSPTDTLAIEIKGENASDKKEVTKFKAFFDSNRGTLAEGPAIENIKTSVNGATAYIYAVTFKLPDAGTAPVDIAGNIAVAKTLTSSKATDTPKYTLEVTSVYDTQEVSGTSATVNGTNKQYVLKFVDVTEVDIEFGNDLALFTVNASGQEKVNVKYSTKFNADFASKYQNANVEFVTFVKNPSFNRTGDLYIYAEKDTFIYEVTEDGAKAISSATYDEDYAAWKIKTRTLGAYAISDVELKTETAPESSIPAEESKPVDNGNAKPNPGTGR